MTDDVYNQSFSVPFDYPVHFTRGVFETGNDLLEQALNRRGEDRRHRCAVYLDAGLAAANAGLVRRIIEYFHARQERLELALPPQLVPGGHAAKTGWQSVRDVIWTIGNLHLDRQSFVIAVGGGSMLDMVGFATSIVHRGLRLVRVPSTTLAQNDAGVGVKNGMDEHGQKNFLGTFAPPFAVLNDFALLATLDFDHWIGGVAEAFKVAVVSDADFLSFLCGRAGDLRNRDMGAMEQAIRRCATLHLEHIRTSGDPFEFGSARPLDFGHWSAHKLETLSGYQLSHGQAVAIGIALDSYYAMRHDLLTASELETVVTGLAECGLPIWSEYLLQRRSDGTLVILEGLEQFREHLGGSLTVTMPAGLGSKRYVHTMSAEIIEQGANWLKLKAGTIGR